MGDFFIKEIVLFDPAFGDSDIVCGAVMFTLSDGGCFFLDPGFPWGIKPGERELYRKWQENRRSRFPGEPEKFIIA